MGIVIVPQRSRRQPVAAVRLDTSHPLGGALTHVWLGTDLSGRDVNRGLVATPQSGSTIAVKKEGLAIANGSWQSGTFVTLPRVAAGQPFIQVCYGYFTTTGAAPSYINVPGSNSAIVTYSSGALVGATLRFSYGTSQNTANIAVTAGAPVCAILQVLSDTDYRLYVNGQMVTGTLSPGSPIPAWTGVLRIGAQIVGGQFLTGVGFGRTISDADALRITARPELLWEMFLPDSWRIYVPASAGGAIALAGAASAIASASGALAVSVPLVGGAIGVTTATGSLSTAIPLAGAAAAVSSAGGVVTLGIALSGAALASAVASGQMQVAIALSGAAIAQAAASGALGVSSGSALSGSAAAHASASGALSVAVPLAGAAQVHASATGNLTTGSSAALAGAAVAVTTASGALTVTVSLSGTAMAQAVAAGGMRLQVPLSGQAVMHATAMGYLSGGQAALASDPRYTVTRHALGASVRHGALHTTIAASHRNFTVHAH